MFSDPLAAAQPEEQHRHHPRSTSAHGATSVGSNHSNSVDGTAGHTFAQFATSVPPTSSNGFHSATNTPAHKGSGSAGTNLWGYNVPSPPIDLTQQFQQHQQSHSSNLVHPQQPPPPGSAAGFDLANTHNPPGTAGTTAAASSLFTLATGQPHLGGLTPAYAFAHPDAGGQASTSNLQFPLGQTSYNGYNLSNT